MNMNGETLRIWRTMKNMKQITIAKKLNISQQEYSKWENRKNINADCLNRFLVATNCSIEELEAIKKIQDLFV